MRNAQGQRIRVQSLRGRGPVPLASVLFFYDLREEGVGTSSSHLASADRVGSTKVILQIGAFVLTSPPPPLVALGDSPTREGMGGLVTPDPVLRTRVLRVGNILSQARVTISSDLTNLERPSTCGVGSGEDC
jgi:hypothetical protein